MNPSLLKNIPNLLSLFRLLLIPCFVYFYQSQDPNHEALPLLIFILATFTDVLDGYLARRFHLITKLGTVLDPLADKLMLLTVLLCLYLDGRIPFFVLLLLLLKESFMILSGIYLYFVKDKVVIPSNYLGKAATAMFFLGVVLVLFQVPQAMAFSAIILALVLKFIALYSYIRTYKKIKAKRPLV